MSSRAFRWVLGWSLMVSGWAVAAEAPARTAPARPGASKTASSPPSAAAAKLISITEVATKLGLKVTSTPPGAKVTLADGSRRLILESGSRETLTNGLRVFLGNPVTLNRGEFYVSVIDYETCLVPLLKPALIKRRPARPKVIAIDPGHGGVDQGTENRRLGYKEKIFTLDVARRLKPLLEKMGFTVVLTRTTDVAVDKITRVLIANRAAADVFVSIHFNSLPNDQKTQGTEVFTFAPQFQRSTNSWSPLEPDDTERESAPANEFDPWNSLLAHAMHRELLGGLKTWDRGKKIAHLGVLRGLTCAGVLVESGFLSNDAEARKIGTENFRQQTAVALAAGIQAYAAQIDVLRLKP